MHEKIDKARPSSSDGRRRSRRAALAAATAGLGLGLGVGAAASTSAAGAEEVTAAASTGSLQGTVASVDAARESFIVKTRSGSRVAVKVTSATTYRDSLVSSPSFATIKVGDSIAVIGTSSSGVESALIVIIGGSGGGTGPASGGPGGFGGFRNGTLGTVASVDLPRDTFTVKTASGSTVKVKVTRATTYRDAGVSSPGLADVKPGAKVAVIGATSNGVQTATTVALGRFGGRFGPRAFGTVTSVDRSAGTFALKSATGSTVKVKVTASTSFRDPSVSKASFADVSVGKTVAVVGTTSHGVDSARSVIIGFPSRQPATS